MSNDLQRVLTNAEISISEFKNAMHIEGKRNENGEFLSEKKSSRCAARIPSWAFDDAKVKAVILARLRAYCWSEGIRVLPESEDDLPALRELAGAAHVRRIKRGARLSGVQGQYIESQAEQGNPLLTWCRIVHMAYREQMNSAQIAKATGMSPVCVRQLLHRLNKQAKKLFPEDFPAPVVEQPNEIFP